MKWEMGGRIDNSFLLEPGGGRDLSMMILQTLRHLGSFCSPSRPIQLGEHLLEN